MLLILKQPDFGMTMVWVPVILAMLFVGGMPKRYIIYHPAHRHRGRCRC